MKRILFAIFILIGAFLVWQKLTVIKLRVAGQPSSTGLITLQLEQPFFASLQSMTNLPIELEYKSLDELGIKDTYQLPMMKEGIFDLISLRFVQNIQNEITIDGLDLTGLNLSDEKGRELSKAYSVVVDKNLQEKYHVKLLGLWAFGPQELFCSKPIKKLSDLYGYKVRVAGESMTKFIAALGAIPVILPFEDTREALKNQIIDCAITSATSANSAGWLNYIKYYVPFTFNNGVNGYAITLYKWNQLNEKQRLIFQEAFNQHTENIWKYSQLLRKETQACMLGQDSCKQKKYEIVQVDMSDEDIGITKKMAKNISLNNWVERCIQEYPHCSDDWIKLAGPYAGID